MGMKIFEAIFDENQVDGVFGISLVLDPAMKGQFIALKKQKVQFKTIDEEKRIVVGLVLEPNKLIPRNGGDGEPFNMIFSEDTITSLCYAFTKNEYNKNSSIEHSDSKIEGVTFVENWIVRDEKIDTGIALGLDVKKGQWLSVSKIDNDEVWDDYIKTGAVKGFSIDAMLSLKEVNLKSNIEMAEEKKSFSEQVNEVLVSLGLVKDKVELGSVQSGDLLIEYDGEVLEVGTVVFVTEGEERVALPDNEYPTENGNIVVVDGVVTEVKSEEPVEAESEAPATPAVPSPEDAVQAIKSLLIKYNEDNEARFKTLEDANVEFKAENETLKAEVVELSKQPAAKAVKTKVKQKTYAEMTNYEKLKFNRGE